jgi:hypothetical protein
MFRVTCRGYNGAHRCGRQAGGGEGIHQTTSKCLAKSHFNFDRDGEMRIRLFRALPVTLASEMRIKMRAK